MSRYTTLLFVLLLASLPIFFYHLGQSSLADWDEAWYAEIARNILLTHQPFLLSFNGSPYVDHPPAGFWLTALSESIFGPTEFGARAASATAGVATLVITYLLGTFLFSRPAGLAASIALLSSPWFVFRARSANLDVYLTFFFVLTFYLGLRLSRKRSFLYPFLLSLSLLTLTKTFVPFTILPALAFILLPPFIRHPRTYRPLLLYPLLLLAWITTQSLAYPNFLLQYFHIGLPQIGLNSNPFANLSLTKSYLHFSLGNWFRPAVLAAFLAPFTLNFGLLALTIFDVTFLLPFLFSPKGQIWHLIPTHPFLLLTLFGTLYWLLKHFRFTRPWSGPLVLIFALVIALPQLARNWTDFIAIPAFRSDEAILASAASNYSYPLTIDEDFVPAAVFYSHKHVIRENVPSLQELFSKSAPLLLITHDWRLDRDHILPSQYTLIKKDRDRVLILKN